MKRTQIQDFEKIDQAKDLDDIVKDKRTGKRANKKSEASQHITEGRFSSIQRVRWFNLEDETRSLVDEHAHPSAYTGKDQEQ